MKVVFAGTPDFAVAPLKAIAEQHQVLAVFTQPDRKAGRGKKLTPPPVKVFAESQEIPVFQPTTLKDQADLIASLGADVMVVVAYGMLLPQQILDIPPLGCINIHASLLPRWRGAAPIQRALEAGDDQTGVSIMRMEIGLDTGPVYQMLTTDINEQDTSASLHDRLSELGAKGIVETLEVLADKPDTTPIKQDHDQASYAKKISKEEATIDWQQSARHIELRMRAFFPWPGCQTQHNGTRIRVWQASVINQANDAEPGTVIEIDDDGIYVACGDQQLRLETLQRDGSKALSFKEFRNGYTIAVGDKLGPAEE